MPEKKIKTNFLQAFLNFPKVPKSVKERKILFQEIVTLIEKSKDSLPKELKIEKGACSLILDSDNYMFTINFKRVAQARIMVNKIDENLEKVNNVANIIINLLNTVMKEKARDSSIMIAQIFSPLNDINLSAKFVGISQLAKANEITKESLTPLAIAFEFKKDNLKYVVSSFYSKDESPIQNAISIKLTLSEPIPFDLLLKEHEKLNYAVKLIEKLYEGEL